MKRRLFQIAVFSALAVVVTAQTAELDPSFSIGTGFNNQVKAIAVQSDGKILVGGAFTTFNGVSAGRIARLNSDGTMDNTFLSGTGFSAAVHKIVVQPDGKILVAGSFSSYKDTARYSIARLNSNGTVDKTFNTEGTGLNGYVEAMALQNDGKIVLGGSFTNYNSISRNRIVRLNSDGTLDAGFTPGTGFSALVRTIAINGSGSIAVGGDFMDFNGTQRNYLALLNSNGSNDAGFNANTLNIKPYDLAFQNNGQLIVGGIYSGYTFGSLARVNSSGTTDNTFNVTTSFNSIIRSIAIQPDSQVIVGGDFTKGIYRFKFNGSLSEFVSGTGLNTTYPTVSAIVVQGDKKVIVGGLFTAYDGETSNYIARLGSCKSITINKQPQASSICENGNGYFRVKATGTSPGYQWQVSDNSGTSFQNLSNGGIYSGATSDSLLLTSVTNSIQAYQYRCKILDGGCAQKSSTQTVSVLNQTISGNPVDKTVCEGTTATINATVSGSQTSLKWQLDNGSGFTDLTESFPYSGTTTATLTITGPGTELNGYKYRLVASACTPQNSQQALLTVNAKPKILQQPVTSQGICQTGDALMSLVTDNGNYTFQWQLTSNNISNGGVYSGVTNDTLKITGATTAYDNKFYRCLVTNPITNCVSSTNYSVLYVYTPPTINLEPTDVTKCISQSGNVTFSTGLTSTPSGISYQWQVDNGTGYSNLTNDTLYTGTTSNSLTLQSAKITSILNGNKYRCIVGKCSPQILSTAALLTLDSPAKITKQPMHDTLCIGESGSFDIETEKNNEVFQWQVSTAGSFEDISNVSPYSGTGSQNLAISNVNSIMGSYYYKCKIQSGSCTSYSNQARMLVREAPSISTQPSNISLCVGSSGQLKLSSINHYSTYQWQVDEFGLNIFTNLPENSINMNTKTNQLTLQNVSFSMNNSIYRCIVGQCKNPFVTEQVKLTVNTPPLISQEPANTDVCVGYAGFMKVNALGSSLGYQWQEVSSGSGFNINDNSNISGTQNDTLLFMGSNLMNFDGRKYRCIVSNGACKDTTQDVLLNVHSVVGNPSLGLNSNQDPVITVSANTIGGDTAYIDFGDGKKEGISIAQVSQVEHTYSSNGSKQICLKVYSRCDTATRCIQVNISQAVGIENQISEKDIQIYPVPNQGWFTIANHSQSSVEAAIINSLGQNIKMYRLEGNTSIQNEQKLNKGIYLIRLKDVNGKSATRKLVVNP